MEIAEVSPEKGKALGESHGIGRLNGLNVNVQFKEVSGAGAATLSASQLADWNDKGYISNLPLLSADELAEAREFFSQLDNDPAQKTFKFNTHSRHSFGYDLVRHPRTMAYLQDLIGPDIVCFISEYINKAPGAPAGNHGHQDCVFNAMDVGCPIVWLALDDADEGNGCMMFVPGSHKFGVLECGKDHALFDISPFQDWVPARVSAGHCVIMSDMLIHSSPANPSTTRFRPGYTATYASARTRLHTAFTAEPILCHGSEVDPSWLLRSRPTL